MDKPIHQKTETLDVIIVGGSYAGLSAGLALGRAVRKVVIIDAGKPCNAQTPYSHNFITQDGNSPREISALAKDQVLRYPTVSFEQDSVVSATKKNGIFSVITETSKAFTSKALLLATGIKDLFPEIQGLKECWGISVLHCPYCHGYEVRDSKLAVLANGDSAMEFVKLILNWSRNLILLTNGKSNLSTGSYEFLKFVNVTVIEHKITKLINKAGQIEKVCFENGENIFLNAIFTRLPFEHHTQIAKDLGCDFTETNHIAIDDLGKTNVAGIYAAGDCTTPLRSLSIAVASGTKAGSMINKDLIEQHFQLQEFNTA